MDSRFGQPDELNTRLPMESYTNLSCVRRDFWRDLYKLPWLSELVTAQVRMLGFRCAASLPESG